MKASVVIRDSKIPELETALREANCERMKPSDEDDDDFSDEEIILTTFN